MTLKTIEGTFIAPKGRYALVVGRFNSFVVESLVSGAVDALVRHGVNESDITIVRAPGAFEIPLVAQKVAQRNEFAAIIALGAVIRGGTPHFEYVAGECTEVGMYLAMSRVAHREGYPEIGMYWEKAAFEEAEHAAKFAELLGEVVTDSTQKNLEMRVEAENGATAGKFDLASRAKAAGLDAIHDTVHEMAKDEARHGKAFEGLLKRYFNK